MRKIAIFICALLSACGGGFEARNQKFMKEFSDGEYARAGEIMVPKKEERYLSGLQCGAGFMWANSGDRAQQCFAISDEAILNSPRGDYTPLAFEQIMLNTYQGISATVLRDGHARVFFNRAYQLQVQSVQDAAKQIDNLADEFRSSARKIPGMPPLETIVNDVSRDLDRNAEVAAMSDFVNPYATWLAAIYRGVNGDLSNSENFLSRVAVFAPDNKFVSGDMAAIRSRQPQVWIVLEDGLMGKRTVQKLAPRTLQQWNINLSIPDVAKGTKAKGELTINGIKTQPLADMTRIAKTDLSKFRRRDIIASVVFEIAKVAAAGTAFVASEITAHSKAANQQAAGAFAFALLGRAALVAIMAQEKSWEMKGWEALPNTVSIARLPMPASRKLNIDGVGQVEIPADIRNAVVFVRIPSTNAKPGVIVGKLN
ncbi:MAG: hypothetical protein FWD33_03495 [Alphaproteobacteria bacterium]|nr:hypothetical protein [Alphaproteobacteria bacterium]